MKYKIETKPTLWDVLLSHGEYSSHEEYHYFIRANDREEAWYLFKEYWQDCGDSEYSPVLILKDVDGKTVETFTPRPYTPRYPNDRKTEWDEDEDYGDAQAVVLSQLNVIVFKG